MPSSARKSQSWSKSPCTGSNSWSRSWGSARRSCKTRAKDWPRPSMRALCSRRRTKTRSRYCRSTKSALYKSRSISRSWIEANRVNLKGSMRSTTSCKRNWPQVKMTCKGWNKISRHWRRSCETWSGARIKKSRRSISKSSSSGRKKASRRSAQSKISKASRRT